MHLPDAEVHVALEDLYRSGRFAGTFGAGLSVTVPDDRCTAGSVTEVVAASYQRVPLASGATGFAAAVERAIETIVASIWPAPLEDWGVVLSIVLFDTLTKATGVPVGAVRLSTGTNVIASGSAPVAPAGLIRFIAP